MDASWDENIGSSGASTSYTVNGYGEVTDYYDANSHHTQYAYDSYGNLHEVTTPLSKHTFFTSDALGFRTSRTDALTRETDYTPDAWERLVTTTYPDSSTKTFSYDYDNNLTGFTDGTGTTARTYDGDERILTETVNSVQTATYVYDLTGQLGLLSTFTDANGRTLTYAYTTRNELYSVSETAGTTTYSYDANGNEMGITNENGTVVSNTYDIANNLTETQTTNSDETIISSFSYTPDADNRRHICDELDGSEVTYGYDYAGRLNSEVRTGTNPYSTSYTLDGVGNRTSQTIGSATTAFTLDNDDELTATTTSTGGFVNSYSYNANGEQTGRTLSGTSYTLAYDYDGQVTSITQGDNTVSFTYDALGRRVSRTASDTTTTFQFDEDQIVNEKQGDTFTAAYTYGNALVRKDGETPLFDGLGSERQVTNSSQTVTGTINYDAFGNTVGTTGSSSNPYMFGATSGYRNDGDAGLMQVGARYYDAQVGAFTTRDTDLSQAPYQYCEHDPVNGVDPSGHWPRWITGYIVGGIAGGLVVIGAAILFPVAGATVIGAIAIGAVSGAVGGIAGYGWGNDPGDITWGGIGVAAGGGAITGAIGGAVAGQSVLPWIGRLLAPIRAPGPVCGPLTRAVLFRTNNVIQ